MGIKRKFCSMRFRDFAIILMLIAGILASANGPALAQSSASQDKTSTSRRAVDRNMEKVALRLYKSALKFYFERAYWKAARELIILLDYYPAFGEADGVLCHLGECLYSMGMFKSSHKMFRFLVTKFPQSEYVAQGLHGLQRIQYQAENYQESLKIHDALARNYQKSDLMDGINYFGGMAHYHLHDYDNAVATMEKIGSRSEFYDYGLYATGLAHLKKKASTAHWPPCAS